MADLHGVILAMQTPFDEDGSVNYDKFCELIEKYVESGVHGIVISSGSGQHPYLTEEECNKLLSLGVKKIDGRASVVMQTSALNMSEVLRRSIAAESLGADAIMVLPPFFEGPVSEDGIFKFYQEVDKAVGIDIVGYNIPAATQVEITPALYRRLLQLENFNYIKDSSADLTKTQQLIKEGGKVLNGADPIAPYAFMAGAVGAIWGSANFMPEECVELYTLIHQSNFSEALDKWTAMFPASAYLWYNDYIPAVKAASRHMGYDVGTVRPPLVEIPDASVEALISTLSLLKH